MIDLYSRALLGAATGLHPESGQGLVLTQGSGAACAAGAGGVGVPGVGLTPAGCRSAMRRIAGQVGDLHADGAGHCHG